MTIKFGTDGWRAVISDTFTFGNLRLVAQAIADYIWEEMEDDHTPEVSIRPLRGRGVPGVGR
jgi:phosphomannomutase